MFEDARNANLEQKLDRRSFLRGSSRFAAALGLALVAPVAALAQSQEQQKPDEKKKEKDPDEALFDEPGNDRVTKIDENGREYRSCPQCGANMYRQGRTWTCENCGYSYVE